MADSSSREPGRRWRDVREIATLLVRHWVVIALTVAALAIPTIVLNENAVRIYEAGATVVYERQSETPAALVLPRAIFVDNTVSNQIQEIRSLSAAEDVARALPPDVLGLMGYPRDAANRDDRRLAVARNLQGSLSVSGIRDSDVLYLRVQATSPVAAEAIANIYAEVAVRRSEEIARSKIAGLRTFLSEQIELAEANLTATEIALRDFKKRTGVVQMDLQASRRVGALGNLEQGLAEATAERHATQARLDYLTSRLDSTRATMVPSIEDISSPVAKQLREELVKRETSYASLVAAGYTEDHPELVRERRAIEDLRARLTAEISNLMASSLVDPLDEASDLARDIMAASTEFYVAQVAEDALRQQVSSLELQVSDLPDVEIALIRLEREKRVAEETYTMLKERNEEARITEAGAGSSLRILDRAVRPSAPIRPNKLLNLLIAVTLGLGLGVGLAFLIDSLDTSVRTAVEVEGLLGVPVIGMIPTIRGANGGKRLGGRRKRRGLIRWSGRRATAGSDAAAVAARLVTRYEPKSATSEAYRTLRTGVLLLRPGLPLKAIVVTSPGPQEGKSTTVANLAITFAQMGAKTLLVDTDLRRPIQHELFQVPREPGVVDALFGLADVESAIRPTAIENLHVLPCGTIPPNPSEVMGSEQMRSLVETFKQRYDLVLFDSPPAITVTDAVVLGSSLDGVCTVVAAGLTERDALARMRTLLETVRVNMIGAVLNNVPVGGSYGSYGYQSYYYYYGREKSDRG